MVAHCLVGLPDEACGLLGGDPAHRRGRHLLPDPQPGRLGQALHGRPQGAPAGRPGRRGRGQSIIGVFHSHTHTEAYPSPTDVAQAPDPAWHYVLVSLRDTEPVVRSYRIVDGDIEEEPVRLLGPVESSPDRS